MRTARRMRCSIAGRTAHNAAAAAAAGEVAGDAPDEEGEAAAGGGSRRPIDAGPELRPH